jgi:tetratricopeptide (TPR) repeat protein
MTKPIKILALLPILIILSHCAAKKAEISPQQLVAYYSKTKEADAQFKTGSYIGLKNAWSAYREFLAIPAFRKNSGLKFIKTSLLLAIREKELGILNPKTLQKVSNLINQEPYFANYSRYVEIVKRIPENTKGITGDKIDDSSINAQFEWIKQNFEPVRNHLLEKSVSTDFYAYLYLSFHSAFSYKFEEDEDFSRFASIFLDSKLIKFKLSIYPQEKPDALKELLQDNPDFYEADYFLGNIALNQGKVLAAENHYKKALEHITESTSLIISLTKVYFHMEEFETCLEFNNLALQLAPEYRDAILGKAMCLSYMGRHEEAIEILDNMIELGKYYMGETYYWLAWNQNELEQLDKARINVTRSRDFLIGHYEVSLLDGIVAYKQKRLNKAEENFKEALLLNNQDCESAYYLGKIYAEREDWKYSGSYFEKGALCNEQTEKAIKSKILEIREAALSTQRKDKLIKKKKIQLLQTRQTKATCQFNAAASYFNSKEYKKAFLLAEKAAEHPTFKQQAEELILAIKEREKQPGLFTRFLYE